MSCQVRCPEAKARGFSAHPGVASYPSSEGRRPERRAGNCRTNPYTSLGAHPDTSVPRLRQHPFQAGPLRSMLRTCIPAFASLDANNALGVTSCDCTAWESKALGGPCRNGQRLGGPCHPARCSATPSTCSDGIASRAIWPQADRARDRRLRQVSSRWRTALNVRGLPSTPHAGNCCRMTALDSTSCRRKGGSGVSCTVTPHRA